MGLKGHTNNPKGKPVGTKSAKTKQWEQLGDFLTDAGAKRAMEVLNDLSDKDYLEQYGKLLNYFKPRMQSSSIDAKVEPRKITGITFDTKF